MNRLNLKTTALSLLSAAMLLCSCEKNEPIPEPTPEPIPVEYELHSFELLDKDKATFDTIPGEYSYFTHDNYTSETVKKGFHLDSHTSSFFHHPKEKLPEGANIDSLIVHTPFIDSAQQLHPSQNKFPLALGKRCETIEKGTRGIIVEIPPFHNSTQKGRYIGYGVKLPYKIVLKNSLSGEQITLTGLWEGMNQCTSDFEGGLKPLK